MKRIVCHTANCLNEGVVFLWDYDTDEAHATSGGVMLQNPTCGGCNQKYYDITDDSTPSTGAGGMTVASVT